METARLHMRLLDGRDAALYRELYTCPQVMRAIMPPLTAQAADRAFQHACRHNGRELPGHRFWCIEPHDHAGAIGMAALQRKGDSAELGVLLRPAWQHRGVSSEAFVVLLGHAFAVMGLAEVVAQRPDDAHALIIDKLLGRFGFRRAADTDVPAGDCRWRLPRARWDRQAADPRL